MKKLSFIIAAFILTNCGGSNNKQNSSYIVHKNITSTIFWVGEEASSENKNIANIASAWDDHWLLDFGGVDDPNSRDGYKPKSFTPLENPFYAALPFNDFDKNGNKKEDLSFIPWQNKKDISICKNRWIKITKNGKSAYAQWEDVGPFGEDDKDYVFGSAKPKNSINNNAGIDLSPAIRDYLNLKDIDTVSWQFIDEKDVPNGPWKEHITTYNINWSSWPYIASNATWQWQLQGDINKEYNVDFYDIDLFDSSKELIESLKKSGKKVICYFSAGSYEDWREDSKSYPASILGKELDGWEEERWIDIRALDKIIPIIKKRLELAKEKGCDAVEPDNMDAYSNDSGFKLSANDQIIFNKTVANEAHRLSLSVALKNDLNQIEELEVFFDFAINEQCHQYNECKLLKPFINSNKAVFNAEYNEIYINDKKKREELCTEAKEMNITTLILPIELDDSFRYSCN